MLGRLGTVNLGSRDSFYPKSGLYVICYLVWTNNEYVANVPMTGKQDGAHGVGEDEDGEQREDCDLPVPGQAGSEILKRRGDYLWRRQL